MFVTSQATAAERHGESRGSLPGGHLTWLIDRTAGDAREGAVALLELDPGAEQQLHAHPHAEEATIVLTGGGQFLTEGGVRDAASGRALYAPAGAAHGLRAGSDGLKALIVLGIASAEEAGWSDAAAAVAAGPVVVRSDDAETMVLDDPAQGFRGVTARWVVDAELAGSTGIVVGRSEFAPGGAHELHRHPGCAEFFYLLEGQGVHLGEGAEEVPAKLGDIALFERASWHGFRNTGHVEARSIFGYLGVASFQAGGYELPGSWES
jgi:quercetin dioxygenase-like cupin family protein